MKKVSINRLKAKVSQYRVQQSKAKSNMIQGNVNDYIKDLIDLYNTKSQMPKGLIAVEVKR